MRKILTLSLLSILSVFFSSSIIYAQSLSKNDQLFREDIQYRLSMKSQSQIMSAINGYKAKIAKMNKADADALTDSILWKVEAILHNMRISEPLDKSLEKPASTKYLAYTLIKFELTLLK